MRLYRIRLQRLSRLYNVGLAMTQLVREPKLYEARGNTLFVDRIISATNSIEETIEAPVIYVTDVADLDIAEFRGLWIPERVTVPEVNELAGVDLRGPQRFHHGLGRAETAVPIRSPEALPRLYLRRRRSNEVGCKGMADVQMPCGRLAAVLSIEWKMSSASSRIIDTEKGNLTLMHGLVVPVMPVKGPPSPYLLVKFPGSERQLGDLHNLIKHSIYVNLFTMIWHGELTM